MNEAGDIVYEFDTDYGHYMIIDMIYDGRSARVLFSGDRQAAQSGIAYDGKPDLLFDYNQRMFELATGLNPKKILIIGGGMFTLPSALLKALPKAIIDVVELDEGLTAPATKYFDLPADARLTIINNDGLNFLGSNNKQYDLILIDAYTHASAEPSLGSAEAIGHLRSSLAARGVVGANVIAAYFGRRCQALHKLCANYESQFESIELYPASQNLSLWLPQNLLLTAQLDPAVSLDSILRLLPLEPSKAPFNLRRDII